MTPSAGELARAAEVLRAGGLVAFPTETVYGLGADATNDRAVAAIYAAKGRPSFNPLIVHVLDAEAAAKYVVLTPLARKLIDRFWPGPLSIVLPRVTDCPLSLLVSAGLPTAAVRAPAHPLARELLAACGRPIAAPSANRSNAVSPTTAAHVAASLPGPDAGGPEIILDGGPCRTGLESTVVDATGEVPVVLRPGGVTAEDIEAAVGAVREAQAAAKGNAGLASPGMLARHYAPGKPVRLNADKATTGEALLAFGPGAPAGALNLSPAGDLTEAAANLFAMLHALDAGPAAAIAVMPVPDRGLGRAINDRLRRAARPENAP